MSFFFQAAQIGFEHSSAGSGGFLSFCRMKQAKNGGGGVEGLCVCVVDVGEGVGREEGVASAAAYYLLVHL